MGTLLLQHCSSVQLIMYMLRSTTCFAIQTQKERQDYSVETEDWSKSASHLHRTLYMLY